MIKNFKIGQVYKFWLISIFIVLFFVFNISLSYATISNQHTTTNMLILQLSVSGLLYFLSFISFIQFFFFKESIYSYYVLYLLLYLSYFTLIFSYKTTLDNQYIPYFLQLRPVITLLVLISSYYIYTLFAMAFLNSKTKDLVLYKWLNVLSKVYLLFLFIICFSFAFLPENISETIKTIIISTCIPLGLIGIFVIYKRAKNVFGLILCFGSSFIFLGSVLGFLFSFQILNYPIQKFPFNNWLFYTMLGAIMEVIMFFSSFAYRNKVLATEEKVAKEKLQLIRDEISRDLHDDVGASLSNINILNELAKRNTDNPLKANEYLNRASEDIQQVSESLSDIVWNINSRYDDLENLFIRMKRYASDMLDGKNIDYEIEFPDHASDLTIGIDKRKDLYFIFKEGVNNIIKYSEATQAKIFIKINHPYLDLSIIDNGKGFPKEKIGMGNGLQNMQHRANVWNAQFKIETEEGVGTSILLKMRLN